MLRLPNLLPFTKRNLLGWLGERKAISFLKAKGYKIICTNFRAAGGEIDLIAQDIQDNEELVFVEVKTRRQEVADLFDPLEAVDQDKINQISKIAELYLQQFPESSKARIDLIAIIKEPGWFGRFRVEHIIDI